MPYTTSTQWSRSNGSRYACGIHTARSNSIRPTPSCCASSHSADCTSTARPSISRGRSHRRTPYIATIRPSVGTTRSPNHSPSSECASGVSCCCKASPSGVRSPTMQPRAYRLCLSSNSSIPSQQASIVSDPSRPPPRRNTPLLLDRHPTQTPAPTLPIL